MGESVALLTMNFFFKQVKQPPLLGVDIGTGSIKVVKLQKYLSSKKDGAKGKLENYGTVKMKSFRQSHIGGLQILDAEGIAMLRLLLSRLHEETKDAVFSIPMYSAFVQEMTLPPMLDSELPNAVDFEARSRIPVPFKDVKMLWELIKEPKEDTKGLPNSEERHVLLIAVPNDIVFRYQNIAKEVGLNVYALEVEILSVMRALDVKDDEPFAIIDIGARNTNISFIKNGFLRFSHNIEKGGDDFSQMIAHGLGIDMPRAEALKIKEGFSIASTNKELSDLLFPVADNMMAEIKRVLERIAPLLEGQKLPKVILIGGSANLKGFKEYLATKLNASVEIPNPWSRIDSPPALKGRFEERPLSFVVATGLALY